MGTISTIKNSLIILSTTGHLCFQMVILYQLCYLMKLIKGTKPTMMDSLIILLSIGQLCFGMVILQEYEYYIGHEEFIDFI